VPELSAIGLLRLSARGWFVVAALGQLMFAVYIGALYGRSALTGNLSAWNAVMPRGYTAGDTAGNAAIMAHIALAFLITAAGMLQLIPALRQRVPRLHRWTGRMYILSAFVASLSGLYLIWVRGTVGDTLQHLGTSTNAVVIICCAVLAWRSARAREFGQHRVWALRLFLVSNGVWFFRVGLLLWLLIWQRPVGFDGKAFVGPFLSALTFAQFLVPMLVLELYLRAEAKGSDGARYAVSALIALLTCGTAAGIFGATMALWLPRM
jgi:uncharacterized membrane protein